MPDPEHPRAAMTQPSPSRPVDPDAALGGELDGLTVIALEQAVAAPYCSLLLADAGARVIKVERREGDFARGYDSAVKGHSTYFVWLNRGKESVALDLDVADDVALLHRMIGKADVLLQNFAPGALERRGLAGDALRATNPKLITCEITGYGRSGPYAEMKAYDLLVQAESGLCSITGGADSPARVGVSICDVATGLTAFSAILRALIKRSITGRGIDLSISMFDVMADWMNVPLLQQRYTGKAPARIGVGHPSVAPYELYPARDGGQILISIQNNREWTTFCEKILNQPALAADPRFRDNVDRVRNRAEMNGIIRAAFARHDRADMIALLNAHRIACANLSSIADLEHHPQLRGQAATLAGDDFVVADLPVALGRPRPVRVPLIDEDGARIRTEFSA